MATATTAKDADPHKFLEDVLGKEPLAWVNERNVECLAKYGDPTKTEDYKRILAILDSKDKIPNIAQIGNSTTNGMYYNFWQDDKHVQGIWRKTTLESYQTKSPEWQTVLDLDALPPPTTDTASTWVWHGSSLLDEGPDGAWDRALISLSPGGSDADTTREMNLVTEEFIDEKDGGFAMPTAAKTSIAYRSRDEVLVGTDFEGDGSSMTDSGYARVIKSWKRGTPLSEAVTVFEAEQSDIAGAQYAYHDRNGICHEFQLRSVTFYTAKFWYRSLTLEQIASTTADQETTPFEPIPIPDDAEISTFGSDAMITLRSNWKPPGCDKEFVAGALLAAPMADVMANDWTNNVQCLFEPTPTKSLQSTTTTKDYVILSVLEDVRTMLVVWKHGEGVGDWSLEPSPEDAVATGESLHFSNVNRDSALDNRVFLWRDGYLVPDTMEIVPDVGQLGTSVMVKSNPAMFDSQGLCVEQHFCASKDGTKIPYFVIRRKDMAFDGTNPTLLDAYGGFEISMLPGYSASVGAAWLEQGGVKVVANIRGGGEYGPTWHQAALKAKRYKCYEDMEAVAQDLIDRKITSPTKLACIGGSNGGLLVGNLITRPIASKLFGAAVCQVPLLDMKVYSHLLAGASWMAEYGDPDTEDWKFLRRHSPYHLLRHDNLGLPEEEKDGSTTATEVKNPEWVCPKVLFTTSTRDDRVHPGHARKMVRSLLEEAQPMGKAPEVHYWENTEGGHGGAADNAQRAKMWSLTYSMLKQTLGG
jgi:prolyl oligopeptidase